MREEIAAVLPEPVHAALIILCAVALVAIAVSQIVREVLETRRAKTAERKLLGYARVSGGTGNTLSGRPPTTG